MRENGIRRLCRPCGGAMLSRLIAGRPATYHRPIASRESTPASKLLLDNRLAAATMDGRTASTRMHAINPGKSGDCILRMAVAV